ncbi:MAG: MFS transporter, partial [Planctomycetota bacterium]|nr:MFS transporter [Planctomycetota bacterium]
MDAREHRWFPGYNVAAVATVALAASAPGQTLVISLINLPLRTELGIKEVSLNTAYTVATIAAAIPLVIVGRLTDRFGPKRMMALVALVFGLACFGMSFAQGVVTVFLGFFLLRFLGQGSLVLVSTHATAMWFHRRL